MVKEGSRLIRLQGQRTGSICVCFPPAGSGISIFKNWPESLKNHCQIALIQLPGREDRLTETLHQSAIEIATEVADILMQMKADRLILYGHSMGASLAWLTASMLWTKYRQLSILILAAQPPYARPLPKLEHTDDLKNWFTSMGESIPVELQYYSEMQALFLHVLKQDISWLRQEWPALAGEEYPFPIHCLYGTYDHLVPRHTMKNWIHATNDHFSLTGIPGGHLFLATASQLVTRFIKNIIMIENKHVD